MFHETEANFANLRFVFRGEIHQPREAGPPERPQCEARWPLAQRRPPTGPQKTRTSQTRFFIARCLLNHTSTNQVTTSLRSSIAVSPSLLPAWSFGAAPAHLRGPRAIASYPVPAKRVCRWKRRSGEDARHRSPRWLPTGVS